MSNLLAAMKAERESLVKRLADHKPDPALAARITTLKTELSNLQAEASGADLKAQIAAVDKGIAAVENPGRATRPMSEAGKAAIKAGLQRYHEKKKVTAASPAQATAQPVAAGGEQNVAKGKR